MCFAGGVLWIEITSEENGSRQLSIFDLHRTMVMQTEVGPTTPDVTIEQDKAAKLVDHAGVVWKLEFPTPEDLSNFTANLSEAQDCALSKQCEQEAASDAGDQEIVEVYDSTSPSRAVGRDFRVK